MNCWNLAGFLNWHAFRSLNTNMEFLAEIVIQFVGEIVAQLLFHYSGAIFKWLVFTPLCLLIGLPYVPLRRIIIGRFGANTPLFLRMNNSLTAILVVIVIALIHYH